MKINWTTILKCLIAIQMVAAVGCKKGDSNKPSTRQTRIDNKAKQEAAAAAEAARLKAEDDKKKADEKAGTDGTASGSVGSEIQGKSTLLDKTTVGKLTEGSTISEKDVVNQSCALNEIVNGNKAALQLAFGEDSKKLDQKVTVSVQKQLINDYIKKFKIPKDTGSYYKDSYRPEYVIIKIGKSTMTETTGSSLVTADRSNTTNSTTVLATEGIGVTRSIIRFKDKKVSEITDKDIKDALERIKTKASNTSDLELELDHFVVHIKDKKYIGAYYTKIKFDGPNDVPSHFLATKKEEVETPFIEADNDQMGILTHNLYCEFKK